MQAVLSGGKRKKVNIMFRSPRNVEVSVTMHQCVGNGQSVMTLRPSLSSSPSAFLLV